jgi:hypothetical protein
MLVISILTLVLFFDESNFSNIMHSNAIVNTRVEIMPASPTNCSFQLYTGWNMVSFYCLGLLNERDIVLESINTSYDSIFAYKSNDLVDPWKSYNPSLPNWTVQQLNNIDRLSGYWIYVFSDTSFFYSGLYYNSVITLNSGWNFVGYTSIVSSNISTSLNGIPFSLVKYYDTQADTWVVYYVGGSSNTLNQFNVNKGYWINVSDSSQWNITKG